MLTKKEVTNWVYKVREKAFMSLQEACEKAVKEEEDRIFKESGAANIIKKLEASMREVNREHEKLINLVHENQEMSYETVSCYGLSYYLDRIGPVDRMIRKAIKYDSKKLTQLKKQHEDDERKVGANYAAVLAELKLKSNAKRCVEYLKELGFDTTSLEKLEHTEVSVQLDRRYLFVCGDNK